MYELSYFTCTLGTMGLVKMTMNFLIIDCLQFINSKGAFKCSSEVLYFDLFCSHHFKNITTILTKNFLCLAMTGTKCTI